jgi:hypothetical protein
MTIHYDPDEWESISEYRECSCGGPTSGRCNGGCNGYASYGLRRRTPQEIARIKAYKRQAREDEILAEAETIRRSRSEPAS